MSLDLITDAKDRVVDLLHNGVEILTRADEFKGRFSYDEFSKVELMSGKPMSRIDKLRIQMMFERSWFRTSDQRFQHMLYMSCKQNAFDPLTEYVLGLPPSGEPGLIDRFLEDYMKVEPVVIGGINLTRVFSRKWLIAAVARALIPGCKVDTCLVFYGEQGMQKSTGIKALVPDAGWYNDAPLDIGGKEGPMLLAGTWIYEFAEMHSLSKKDQNQVKQFMTHEVDQWIPKFSNDKETCPRRAVFTATTNQPNSLVDPTGSRRFWPCKVVGYIDVNAIVGIRDQLWAEARDELEAGVTRLGLRLGVSHPSLRCLDEAGMWWLTRAEERAAVKNAERFSADDVLRARVEEALHHCGERQSEDGTIQRVLTASLAGAMGIKTRGAMWREVCDILRALGYQPFTDGRSRGWKRD